MIGDSWLVIGGKARTEPASGVWESAGCRLGRSLDTLMTVSLPLCGFA